MAHIDRVFNYLSRRSNDKGVTASQISSHTKINRKTVMNRIYDLRDEGHKIDSETRIVKGKRTVFYRMAA